MTAPLAIATCQRLLAVMAHPDDEAYLAAATLAWRAQAGAEVTVLCLSRGEAGGDPQTRHDELQRSCELLGVTSLLQWRWPDGEFATIEPTEAVFGLKKIFESTAPDVILSMAADGFYGHHDHLCAHRWVRRAALECGLLPVLWEAVLPPGWFHPLWRVIKKVRPQLVAKGYSPNDFGAEANPTDEVVFLSQELRRQKLSAIAAHRSQLRAAAPQDFLLPGLMEPLLQIERWRSAVRGDD
ncbi:MAG TPA: hypothetical protein DCQ06_12195 [Myxococcales bacterium]|nr:hypothetical protein [Myxococcales bacterium]